MWPVELWNIYSWRIGINEACDRNIFSVNKNIFFDVKNVSQMTYWSGRVSRKTRRIFSDAERPRSSDIQMPVVSRILSANFVASLR